MAAMVENGIQLVIGSHTHELALYENHRKTGIPLLVVGASGGAQANPGCGSAIYCSKPHQYGFADVEVNKKEMTVKIFRHDKELMIERNICRDASVKEGKC